jgi:hypothetical protein
MSKYCGLYRLIVMSFLFITHIALAEDVKPSTPILLSATSLSSGVLIRWDKLEGIDGFKISRKIQDGPWKTMGSSEKNSFYFLDKTAIPGSHYIYTVRAYKKNGDQVIWGGADYQGLRLLYEIPPVAITSYDVLKDNSVKIFWKKDKNVNGYKIWRKFFKLLRK